MLDIFMRYTGWNILAGIMAYLIAVIFAIVIHEVAHGFVAYKNGDDTAKMMGRLTLNPIKHFDLIGFLCFFFIGFGWAKPVPINSSRFRHYKLGVFLTSIAGIVTNIFVAFISAGMLILINKYFASANFAGTFLNCLFTYSTLINLSLAVFNILPIFPLDGFNCLSAFLPYNNGFVMFMRRFGQFILIAILILGLFDFIFGISVSYLFNWFLQFWELIF